MTCYKWFCVALLTVAVATAAPAQPPFPQYPVPNQRPKPNPLEGVWYFRGDPGKICFIETVTGPRGTRLLFTNENGTEVTGQFTGNGRRVTVPGWRLTAAVLGDRLLWSNGDFWSR